jgi:hypothetical protein
MKPIGYETMFVLAEDGEGKWEAYDITIHCRNQEEREQILKTINAVAKAIKDKG